MGGGRDQRHFQFQKSTLITKEDPQKQKLFKSWGSSAPVDLPPVDDYACCSATSLNLSSIDHLYERMAWKIGLN